MKSHKRRFTSILAALFALVFLLAACGPGGQQQNLKIANIAMTDPISSLNPVFMDASEAMKYAVGISWDPIVELNEKLEFEGVLAESVTLQEDGKTFRVKIKDDAKWSDGEPISSDDLIFYTIQIRTPSVGNISMAAYYLIEGFDPETGQVPDDTKEVSGLVRVDDKTVDFVPREPISLENFLNNYMRYSYPIPYHLLKDMTSAELAKTDWFTQPEAVSGAFIPTQVDLANAISFKKNEAYWQGEPKLDRLNIKITDGAQLLAGLESGEIDYVQQTTAVFPQEDQAAVEKLDKAKAIYAEPVTSQFTFINQESIPDKRVRQAMLLALDRQGLVDSFLDGHGEVVDGFLTSTSTYFDSSLEAVKQDLDKAKALLDEAKKDGFDPNREFVFKINSGDQTFVQMSTIVIEQWKQLGLNVKVQTVPLNNLLADAASHSFDILAVQYTLPAAAPALDIAWLTGPDNWANFHNDRVDALLAEASGFSGEAADGVKLYGELNRIIQDEVPMMNLYVIEPLGAKSERLQAQDPSVFGGFMNLHEWDIIDRSNE